MKMITLHVTRLFRTLSYDIRPIFTLHHKRYFASLPSEEIIVKSPAPFLELPKGNCVDMIFQKMAKYESQIALECAETEKKLTYAELAEQSERWSGFLRQVGVSKEDIVTIISPNCLQYGPIFLGTAGVGAALSPINSKATSEEIRRMIGITQSKIFIFSNETEDTVIQALKGRTDDVMMFSIGKPRHQKGVVVVDEILDGSRSVTPLSPQRLTGEETIYMPFSSGTTGPPKAVALSHNAWIASILQFMNPYHQMFLGKPDTTVAMLPFFHIYGALGILSLGAYKGNRSVVMRSFNPQFFIDTIIKHKVTFLHTVPTLLNLLINSPECNSEMMGSISSLFCGAAPVHESAATIFKEKIKKPVMFIEGYGLTETSITTFTPRRFPRLGTCGQLVSNAEAKVINPDTGEYLGPNENGEICIKTPGVMKGYVNNPEETNATLRNGWIHTGDIGFYDSDGFFSIVDRTKDLIKVQGLQVSPTEIEDELLKHGSVVECSVVGIPDEKVGEAPKAFIVLKEKVEPDELHHFLKERLSKHKQLRGGIKFVDALPKSETGKVLRRKLKTIT